LEKALVGRPPTPIPEHRLSLCWYPSRVPVATAVAYGFANRTASLFFRVPFIARLQTCIHLPCPPLLLGRTVFNLDGEAATAHGSRTFLPRPVWSLITFPESFSVNVSRLGCVFFGLASFDLPQAPRSYLKACKLIRPYPLRTSPLPPPSPPPPVPPPPSTLPPSSLPSPSPSPPPPQLPLSFTHFSLPSTSKNTTLRRRSLGLVFAHSDGLRAPPFYPPSFAFSPYGIRRVSREPPVVVPSSGRRCCVISQSRALPEAYLPPPSGLRRGEPARLRSRPAKACSRQGTLSSHGRGTTFTLVCRGASLGCYDGKVHGPVPRCRP